jgi:hypothetical protein
MTENKVVYREVLKYLRKEYKKRGNNFYFRSTTLNLPYTRHQIGRMLLEIDKKKKIIEKWGGNKSPILWKTKF